MTDEAVGIHEHPTKKLGRRPADPTKPRLRLASFLTTIPDHPIVDAAPNLNYPMDQNDVAGDCVVAGSDHALQVIYTLLTGSYTNWTDAQLLSYYQTQNPNFRSWSDGGGQYDQGMLVQDFLSYLVKQGVILGFAAVDPSNEEEMKAATYLGLAIVTGEDLRVAQQSQKVWDYKAGSPDWGGHCTTTVGYKGNPDYQTVVTWGELQDATANFVRSQVSEAWFIITEAHVKHPNFRAGFDINKFAQAYTEITGRPFPADITPGPNPTPDPGPTPSPGGGGDNPFRDALAKYPGLAERLDKLGKRKNQTGEEYSAWSLAKSFGYR